MSIAKCTKQTGHQFAGCLGHQHTTYDSRIDLLLGPNEFPREDVQSLFFLSQRIFLEGRLAG